MLNTLEIWYLKHNWNTLDIWTLLCYSRDSEVALRIPVVWAIELVTHNHWERWLRMDALGQKNQKKERASGSRIKQTMINYSAWCSTAQVLYSWWCRSRISQDGNCGCNSTRFTCTHDEAEILTEASKRRLAWLGFFTQRKCVVCIKGVV